MTACPLAGCCWAVRRSEPEEKILIGHILFAVGLQILVARAFHSWAAGAAVASAWAIAREIAQAEYRWIERYGDGSRANMPWWGGLDYRVWQRLDPWLDWVLPCLVTVAIAMLVSRAKGSRSA